MAAAETPTLRATDLLAVRSRVSWGALAAGAMVSLAIYFLLTLLGLALGIEAAVRRADVPLGAGAAIYSILALLVAMFFGGWATSRLAVGETKLEAVLYGVILWGVLFTGMLWLVGVGVRVGFGAVVGVASGAYTTESGRLDVDRVADGMRRAGVDQATIDKYRDYYERLRRDPNAAADVARENVDPQAAASVARTASWYALIGVVVSMATVVFGSLVGSGDVPVPVPVLGVRRPARDPRM
jgi:hypothetical protein